jgi:hypothetical protein
MYHKRRTEPILQLGIVMNHHLLRFILILLVNIFFSGIVVSAQNTQNTFSVNNPLQSNSGGNGQSETFKLKATVVGLASPVGEGSSSSGKFSVVSGDRLNNSPPMISHEPDFKVAPEKQSLTILAMISDPDAFSVSKALLNYRQGGDSHFSQVEMDKLTNSSYQGTIPNDSVADRGVEYFITANDQGNLTAREPDQGFISKQVQVANLSKGEHQLSGGAQTAYRLFSIPLILEDPNARSVLEDDLGRYDDTKWRFSEILRNQEFLELTDTSELLPGRSYWLIVKKPDKTIHSGPGRTNLTSREFEIPLHSKWNLIGNPFNFLIRVANISLKSGIDPNLRNYTGHWNDTDTNPVSAIKPFEGNAIFIDSSMGDTLLINPDLSNQGSLSAKANNQRRHDDILWSIRILAQCQEARDVDNIAAISSGASEKWDRFDLPEPPVIGGYVSVYFSHPEWEKLSKNFCTDFRPQSEYGDIWDFQIRTNILDKVNLTFKGIKSVPEEFEVWLVDEAAKISRNLRKSNTYSVAGRGQKNPKRLRLLVGKQEFMEEKLSNLHAIQVWSAKRRSSNTEDLQHSGRRGDDLAG